MRAARARRETRDGWLGPGQRRHPGAGWCRHLPPYARRRREAGARSRGRGRGRRLRLHRRDARGGGRARGSRDRRPARRVLPRRDAQPADGALVREPCRLPHRGRDTRERSLAGGAPGWVRGRSRRRARVWALHAATRLEPDRAARAGGVLPRPRARRPAARRPRPGAGRPASRQGDLLHGRERLHRALGVGAGALPPGHLRGGPAARARHAGRRLREGLSPARRGHPLARLSAARAVRPFLRRVPGAPRGLRARGGGRSAAFARHDPAAGHRRPRVHAPPGARGASARPRDAPLARRLPIERAYMGGTARARAWYAQNWRPVTVVIPTYGPPDHAIAAVRALRRTTDPDRVRIVVADDASPPEHRERLRDALDGRAELVLADENAGFAHTANAGMRLAGDGDDVVLVNSDVIPLPGWLEALQHAAYADGDVGIVGPKLLYPDRTIQSAGSYRNLGAPEWFDHRYRFRAAGHPPAGVAAPVIAVTGACMYVKRAAVDGLGLLDERYPMAYEDVDWCLRAWDAGMTVAYEPSATLIHHESKTRGTDQGERELRSQRVFWERWGGWFDGRRVRTDDGRLR